MAGKNIILCSDGTGNLGGNLRPSNVWRTYLAVDETSTEVRQVRIHEDGVGTHDFAPLKLIGGAFGFGISRNLRQLYAALINVHEKGDRIYLFGFSRGAYTVRVLAQMISLFGIPSREGKSQEEIDAFAAKVLKNYKRGNRQYAQKLQALTAEQQNRSLESIDHRTAVETRQAAREAAPAIQKLLSEIGTSDQADAQYPVHFIGCWDTVDALGLPFEELTQVLRRLFRLRFRNALLNPGVHHAVQALALDDERRTFHPRLWKSSGQADQAHGQTIKQVWFAGMHSDVGGGYAKDQLALTPLLWILNEAKTRGLKLNADLIERWQKEASPWGMMHDSRAGLSAYYRYHPRRIDDLIRLANGRPEKPLSFSNFRNWFTADLSTLDDPLNLPPVVHASVIDRIATGGTCYSPTALTVRSFAIEGQPQFPPSRPDDGERMRHLEDAHDYILLNRWCYLLFVLWTVSFLLLGLGLGELVGLPRDWPDWCDRLAAVEGPLLRGVTSVLPEILGTFLLGFHKLPGSLSCMLLLLAILLGFSRGVLLRRTRRSAALAWRSYRWTGETSRSGRSVSPRGARSERS